MQNARARPTLFLGHTSRNREIAERLSGPISCTIYEIWKWSAKNKVGAKKMPCEFERIFGSSDRKLQNQGLSNCAARCLVSSCEVSK